MFLIKNKWTIKVFKTTLHGAHRVEFQFFSWPKKRTFFCLYGYKLGKAESNGSHCAVWTRLKGSKRAVNVDGLELEGEKALLLLFSSVDRTFYYKPVVRGERVCWGRVRAGSTAGWLILFYRNLLMLHDWRKFHVGDTVVKMQVVKKGMCSGALWKTSWPLPPWVWINSWTSTVEHCNRDVKAVLRICMSIKALRLPPDLSDCFLHCCVSTFCQWPRDVPLQWMR